MKPTAGKWRMVEHRHNYAVESTAEPHFVLAVSPTWREPALADMTLMAAAPELLKQLKNAVAWLEVETPDNEHDKQVLEELLERSKKAIDSAKVCKK